MSKSIKISILLWCILNTFSVLSQTFDFDKDLIIDSIDVDDDNDGVPDNIERYPNCETSNIFNWVTWSSITDKVAIGEISVPGKTINVTVTHSVGGMFSSSGVYAGSLFPSSYSVPSNNTIH